MPGCCSLHEHVASFSDMPSCFIRAVTHFEYARRWTVERTISWFQNFRRLCIRYEKSTTLFQGFLHLGCTLILLKQVLG